MDGTAWETGYGTYTSSGTSFARTTRNASSTGSALNVTTAAFLYIDWTATIAQSAERASRGFISGCELAWVSASAIDSGPGKVHIEGLNSVVDLAALTSLTGLITLTASAYSHVYVYAPDVTTTPTIVCSSVTPAAPYAGTARSASGTIASNAANLHRWLGVVLTDAAGTPKIRRFAHSAQSGMYLWRLTADSSTGGGGLWSRVLSAGVATAATQVNCSAFMPPQSNISIIISLIANAVVAAYVAAVGDTLSTSNSYFTIQPSSSTIYDKVQSIVPTSSSQLLQYMFANAPSSGLYLDGVGFIYSR